MTTLIPQRTDHDCAICCIAMALGKTYEEVHQAGLDSKGFDPERGTVREADVVRALGLKSEYVSGMSIGDFVARHRGFDISPESFRNIAWGRRACITVPSLNKEGGWHMVYWDGEALFDPSQKLTYTSFNELKAEEVIVFRERTVVAAAA